MFRNRYECSGNDSYTVYVFAERRQAESARIREKYPDRIPVHLFFLCFYQVLFAYFTEFFGIYISSVFYLLQVIVERDEKSDIPDIDKKK